jgi:hypothetical protein
MAKKLAKPGNDRINRIARGRIGRMIVVFLGLQGGCEKIGIPVISMRFLSRFFESRQGQLKGVGRRLEAKNMPKSSRKHTDYDFFTTSGPPCILCLASAAKTNF